MKKKFILVSLLFLYLLNTNVFAEKQDKLFEKIDLFSEVLEKISNEYVDEVDKADVMDDAINGVLQSLDPYSAYMSPEIYKEMQTETSGKFGGLGIEVGMSIKEAEKRFIFKTLHETKGNRTHAAKTLGISIRTLRNKLNEYRTEGTDFELEPEE